MLSIKKLRDSKGALAKYMIELNNLTYLVTLKDKTNGYPRDAMYPYKGSVAIKKAGSYTKLTLDDNAAKEVYIILMSLAINAYQRYLAIDAQDNLVMQALEDVY